MAETQRRFATMGTSVFKVVDKLINNQRLCRLLKYQARNPFSDEYEDVDGLELLQKQILVTPKIYDESTELMSYLSFCYSDYSINSLNDSFKTAHIRFDIACPYKEWVLDNSSLRPYLIMEEIDKTFNGTRLAGMGVMTFERVEALVLTPQIMGYSMRYKIDEFN